MGIDPVEDRSGHDVDLAVWLADEAHLVDPPIVGRSEEPPKQLFEPGDDAAENVAQLF